MGFVRHGHTCVCWQLVRPAYFGVLTSLLVLTNVRLIDLLTFSASQCALNAHILPYRHIDSYHDLICSDLLTDEYIHEWCVQPCVLVRRVLLPVLLNDSGTGTR